MLQSPIARKKPKLGWIDEVETWKYKLSRKAQKQILWLKENGLSEIEDVLESQFGTPPLQPKRKRVTKLKDLYTMSYRTWRIDFKIPKGKALSQIVEIRSGYSKLELESDSDKYGDQDIHRRFNDF